MALSRAKKARLPTPIVDTAEETPSIFSSSFLTSYCPEHIEEELRLRQEGHERILHIAGLLPFANLSKYDPEHLLSVANFLRTEAVTLQHTILYAHNQYKFTISQLDEINHVRLAKLGIDDSMDTESIEEAIKDVSVQGETSKTGYVSA